MNNSVVTLLIDLVKTAGIVIIFAYLVTRTRFFGDLLDKRPGYKSKLIMIAVFGALSIFGTYGGVVLPSGAIANIRDLGPFVGGLAGGPIVGLGAGLIGGIQRYFAGGFVAVPCGAATVVAGLVGGLVYVLRKGSFPKIWMAMVISACIELFHMGLTLLLARPFEDALNVVRSVIIPMTLSNAAGAGIFAFIIGNLINERRTSREKEAYRAELEKKKIELEAARNIQKSFLPNSNPQIPGFDVAGFSLPALEVGGDFYDFIPISQNRWGFVIADVSGKGFPAALFMALSRTCVRAYAVGKTSASDAISMANNLIAQDDNSDMFVTLFCSMLDTDKKVLHYVNAGHNPPLVLDTPEHGLLMLSAKGIALGVMPGIALEEKEIQLRAGDLVLLYTDGVTEAVNRKNELFGVERLTKLVDDSRNLPAEEILKRIEREVINFSEGQPQFDDLTLLVIKVLK